MDKKEIITALKGVLAKIDCMILTCQEIKEEIINTTPKGV